MSLEKQGQYILPYDSEEPRKRHSPLLQLGTSSFTARGWEKSFYPAGLKSGDYLSYYATRFDALEIDATFYRTPAVSTVKNWDARTPENFLFALKAPQEITHQRVLADADSAMKEFLHATEPLGKKLAVVLLQFPYFSRNTFAGPTEFLNRLKPFLEGLPGEPRFAVELRNNQWLGPRLFDILQKYKVALALIDYPWMPRPSELQARSQVITTDFTYIRWLGDRMAIEERTKVWDKTIVDRKKELEEWVNACRNLLERKIRVFAFANNHYGGHAPDTLRLFEELMEK